MKKARPLILGGILALSYCRTLSLFHGYSAPMQAYRHLPSMNASSTTGVSVFTLAALTFNVVNVPNQTLLISVKKVCCVQSNLFVPCNNIHINSENSCWNVEATVCVGSEWYRYPSSFFLPSSHYHVAWLDDGFTGLLPRPFDPTLGGTTAAPQYFNSKNKASAGQFVSINISTSLPHLSSICSDTRISLVCCPFFYAGQCLDHLIIITHSHLMLDFEIQCHAISSN